MELNKHILLILIFVLISTSLFSQTYTVPSSGSTSYTLCSGTLYDANGNSNYGNSWDGYAVLYPSTPGHFIQLSGTIAGESCCDYLYIYDGVGTGGTILWQGVAGSGTVPLVSSTSGPVTVRFYSDYSSTGQGFVLNVSCCDFCSCGISNLNLDINTTGTNTASVTWNAVPSVPNFILEYGPIGFTPGTGTSISTTNNSCTFSGLSEGVHYDVYLYFDCNNDGSFIGDT
jgi:hypothetical protein